MEILPTGNASITKPKMRGRKPTKKRTRKMVRLASASGTRLSFIRFENEKTFVLPQRKLLPKLPELRKSAKTTEHVEGINIRDVFKIDGQTRKEQMEELKKFSLGLESNFAQLSIVTPKMARSTSLHFTKLNKVKCIYCDNYIGKFNMDEFGDHIDCFYKTKEGQLLRAASRHDTEECERLIEEGTDSKSEITSSNFNRSCCGIGR